MNILEGSLKLIQRETLKDGRECCKDAPVLDTTDTTDLEFHFDLFNDYFFVGAMEACRKLNRVIALDWAEGIAGVSPLFRMVRSLMH